MQIRLIKNNALFTKDINTACKYQLVAFRARSDASCNIAARIQSQFAPKTQVAEFVGSFAPASHYSWSKKTFGTDAMSSQKYFFFLCLLKMQKILLTPLSLPN